MHDSIRLESHGIPTVSVATHEFMTAAGAQASILGRPDFDPVYVRHPIQDQTPQAIRDRADSSIDEIVESLLT
jgi:hypothetical protein